MARFQAVTRFRWLWIPLVLASLGAPVVVWYARSPELTVEYWRRQLESVSESELPGVLEEVAELGDPGIAVLADALDSSREGVAHHAGEALQKLVDEWQSLAPTTAAPKLTLLVDALASRASNYEPESRKLAADLALRVLRWPIEGVSTGDRDHLLSASVKVLQADAPEEDTARTKVAEKPRQASASATLQQPRFAKNLPMSMKDLPFAPSPNESAPSSQPSKPADAPRKLELSTNVEPTPITPPAEPNTPASVSAGIDKGLSLQDSAVVTAGGRITAEELHQVPAIELFRLLWSGSTHGAATIEAEMSRRGYTPRQIEVGKGLTDPDPSQRQRWTELLPGLSGIDAKPWLLWLSRDPHPDVRLSAITLMATSNDPEMLRRVAEVGRSDTDARVRDQAARISADQRTR